MPPTLTLLIFGVLLKILQADLVSVPGMYSSPPLLRKVDRRSSEGVRIYLATGYEGWKGLGIVTEGKGEVSVLDAMTTAALTNELPIGQQSTNPMVGAV